MPRLPRGRTLANNGWRVKYRTERSGPTFEGRLSSNEHVTGSQRPSLVVIYPERCSA